MIFRLGKLVFIVMGNTIINTNRSVTLVISFPVGDGVMNQIIM